VSDYHYSERCEANVQAYRAIDMDVVVTTNTPPQAREGDSFDFTVVLRPGQGFQTNGDRDQFTLTGAGTMEIQTAVLALRKQPSFSKPSRRPLSITPAPTVDIGHRRRMATLREVLRTATAHGFSLAGRRSVALSTSDDRLDLVHDPATAAAP